jgi:ribosomal protein L7Ae-like RNA K-turn-binding protein
MMGSKIAGYEKKIKELLESIDRKDDIVRGLKESKK